MRSMNENQVSEFLAFLKERIDCHYKKMTRTLPHHRVLIKAERAEAEVILRIFSKIINDQPE